MIGIVGGGIAGLAAARRLQAAGREVTVFETSEEVGGLAATYETRGDRLEKFYHHLSGSEETIVELIEELGLGDDLTWPIGKNAYYIDGTIHPMDKPWEILAFPHWNLYDTFRLGMLVLDVDVRGGVPSFDSYEDLRDYEDVPVKEFCIEHTTRNVYETFFEPLLEAKFGERAEDVSAAWLLGRIKFRGERDLLKGEPLGYLRGGFGRLLDELLRDVGTATVETNTRVTDLSFGEAGVEALTAESGDGTTETHDVDSVVVAAMPTVLESLTGYECDIEFQGTVCSVVSMSESLTDTYWLNVADDAPFGALIEHTNFVDESHYGGEHLLYVPKYVQGPEDEVWQMDDDEVAETWLAGIESLFPDFERSQVNWVKTARNPRTAPIYERGYLDMVVPYDLADDGAPGVYYAGMASEAQYPERSLNGGIVAGYEVADRITGRR
ncbi:protoporphyrinogen oxidase [Halarchaeum rubridurum]|uniref:Protoporphyrinogen oxidase n=1 Tax=Halarchaeum rubridurum TaxID=489911 RepID=A0A830FSL7_9EURY|nr:NAD(P)/FAD-dependent oxidoreductase [Halarchaeum rubridurum]MBP1953816.1 protoporphyrinogen oxidase [Halarchaeum rubridurum]GGM54930.1 protoporphyrinogen oxidase [Halarchaeum rubridurum]